VLVGKAVRISYWSALPKPSLAPEPRLRSRSALVSRIVLFAAQWLALGHAERGRVGSVDSQDAGPPRTMTNNDEQ